MLTDLRLACRSLARTPGFTLIAVLTLALGLGVNATVLGLVNEFLIRPLAVRAPHELAFVMQRNPKLIAMPFMLSYPDFQDLRAQIESTQPGDESVHALLAGLAAYASRPAHISQDGHGATRAWIHEVSDNYFQLLGVNATLGRVFQAGEGNRRNADAIAVLSHPYWVQRFAADPGVLGRKLLINGAPFTVIGVAPKGFGGAEAMTQASVFVPAMMADVLHPQMVGAIAARGNPSYTLVARMRPRVAPAAAGQAMAQMYQRLVKAYPNEHPESTLLFIPESRARPSPLVANYTLPALAALMLLAGLVLAVAAANIANLLFARAAAAERTLAIRSSLGASRARLIRQLLTEIVLVALAGAVVGWIMSAWFGAVLASITRSADSQPMAPPAPAAWPFAVTVLLAIITGVAAGIVPAWRATRQNVVLLLKEGAPSAGSTRHPWRTLLVGGQIMFACIVMVCAGQAWRSLRALKRTDLGFRSGNVLIATFDLEMQRYSHAAADRFQRELLRDVRALPGVASAGFARSVPFEILGYSARGGIGAEGYVAPAGELFVSGCVPVTPGFLETLRIRLHSGRAFTDADDANAPAVAIISRLVADHFWPGRDPLGRNLMIDGRPVRVVGLMDDVRYLMMTDANRPLIFLPQAQAFSDRVTLAVRTEKSPLGLAATVEAISHRLDPTLPVHNLTTLERHVATSPLGLMVLRTGATIANTQAILVIVLAVMGIYGLVAFAAARRTREIGIRMALGAAPAEVVRVVAGPSLALTAVSILAGLAIAGALVHALSMLFYGGLAGAVPTMAGVAALLLAVTALACWLPARRATRVNPVEALRAE